LMAVREARAKHLGRIGTADYEAKREIAEERLGARQPMVRRGGRTSDVRYMAVEEIAREVMRLRGMARGTDD